MRLSLDRAVLAEVRDNTAWRYLTGANTGASGGIFSTHADNAMTTCRRARDAPADLVVWDLEATRTISVEKHHQNVNFNVFERHDGACRARAYALAARRCGPTTICARGAGPYLKRPANPGYLQASRLAKQL